MRFGMLSLVLGLLISAGCEAPAPPSESATSAPESTSATEPEVDMPIIEPDDFVPEEGYQALSFADFEPVLAEEDTWKGIEQSIVTTGEPKGYLQSKESYRNFTIRFEYRFLPRKGLSEEKKPLSNTGLLVYIAPEQKIWPESVEVQGKFSEMASVKANGGVPDVVIQDNQSAREMARKPVGEWNVIEAVSKDGALTTYINGTQICQSQPAARKEGFVGFQAEGFPLEIRRVRIAVQD
ncbi:3-keto-disaccharide hydrolase [Rubinisphaera margarita]|uniref:3-keto-disaccharide hydrolase n=1 Tax=Rubinisphaera margarita TaxID=2909586 RepID=UPI001EE98D09|nr:DUF1080 domain-containing protein [Rubinisphaera margarita]MCG6157987.1 DUF1080 domain-containing protein [Rubinisphaera margarita]